MKIIIQKTLFILLIITAFQTLQAQSKKQIIVYADTLARRANIQYEENNFDEAFSLYQQAADTLQTVTGKQKEKKYARILQQIAYIKSDEGEYREAFTYYFQALAIAQKAYKKSIEYADIYNDIGQNYQNYTDYDSAMYYLRIAEKLYIDYDDTNNVDYAVTLNNMGVTLISMNRFDEALQMLQKAKQIQHLIDSLSNDCCVVIGNIGYLYLQTNHLEKALEYYEKVRIIRAKTLGETDYRYALTLNQLGTIAHMLLQYDKAIAYFTEAAEIFKNTFGEEHFYYYTVLNNLATVQQSLGNNEEANKVFVKILEVMKRATMPDGPEIIKIYGNIIHSYVDMRQTDTAIHYLQEVLPICEANYEKTHPQYYGLLRLLALAYYDKGENEKALQQLQEVIAIRDSAHLGITYAYYSDLETCALTCSRLGYYEKTVDYYEKAAQVRHEYIFHRMLFYNTKERLNVQDISMHAYNIMSDFIFNYQFYDNAVAGTLYDELLLLKNIPLTSYVAMQKHIIENSDSTLVEQYKQFKLIRQQQIYSTNPLVADSLSKVAGEMEDAIIAKSTAYGNYARSMQCRWQDVQKSLKEDEVAVEFMRFTVNRPRNDSVVYAALVLRKDFKNPIFVPLCNDTCIPHIVSPDFISEQIDNQYFSGKLNRLVWQPLERYFKKNDKVYFSAYGLLHFLPIEYVNNTNKHVQFIRVSSTGNLTAQRSELDTLQFADLYGGLDYGSTDILAEKRTDRGRGFVQQWKPLAGTLQEVNDIAECFQKKGIATSVHSGTNGTESSFKQLQNKKNSLIHIATHGFFMAPEEAAHQAFFYTTAETVKSDLVSNSLNRCGLIFSNANPAWLGDSIDAADDGTVMAAEIENLNLYGTKLLVLSSCESAMGELYQDNAIGLQTAFKKAGVQSIIMSLWKVDDHVTQLLMSCFYDNWITKGMNRHSAFDSAVQTIRSRYPAPYLWAGFIMLD